MHRTHFSGNVSTISMSSKWFYILISRKKGFDSSNLLNKEFGGWAFWFKIKKSDCKICKGISITEVGKDSLTEGLF